VGTIYSPVILDHIEWDPALHLGPSDAAVAWLQGFAALGLSRRFREAIGDRVAEFTCDERGNVAWRWLPDEEAAPIVAGLFGEDTWEDGWPLDDGDMFLPNCATDSDKVRAPGSPFDGWFCQPLDLAVTHLEERFAEMERGEFDADPDRMTMIRDQLRFCLRHHLIVLIS
jgi:hypothetical protein